MRTFLSLLSVFAMFATLGFVHAEEEEFSLIPNRYASWWKLGENMEFRTPEIPTKLTSLTGRVFDSENRRVAEVTTSREQLQNQGWVWKPEQPGYYEIEFSYTAEGEASPVLVRGHYSRKIETPDHHLEVFEYDKERFQGVVSARPPSPDYARGQFGFSFAEPKAIRLAQLMGFDFAFIQAITWGGQWWDKNSIIEPVKGEYNWKDPDMRINALVKAGFPIAAQFLFTPSWASPHPEKTQIRICTRESSCYAPVEMADFDRFVRATVARYKDRVKIWEIWNEPSIIGQSVFWYDSPENFVRLLQTGYTAVKETQPGAEVWIGGLGPRSGYYEFYRQILALGAAKWFDVLSLHGTWNSPEKFRAIERHFHVPPKPAVMSEWHAILHNMSDAGPQPSESALARRMMLDLLHQLKEGVQRTVSFVVSNASGYEQETQKFLNDRGIWGQSFGLFRARPRLEPRFPALVLQNFLALLGNKATYLGEYNLGGGASAVLLDTAHGRQLVVWLEKNRPWLGLLAKEETPSITLSDWEGRSVAMGDGTLLEAGKLYYISGLPDSFGSTLSKSEVLFSPRSKKNISNEKNLVGTVNQGAIFSDVKSKVSDAILWNAQGWLYHPVGAPDPAPRFTARFAVGASESSLDLVVDVTDAIQVQNGVGIDLWSGDSIQFAFDCDGSGEESGISEFIAALTKRGPEIWKVMAAETGGDLPVKWSPSGALVANASCSIDREGDRILYKVRLPWSELYPLTYELGKPLRFSILVNNNDGKGRDGYLEWSGGIGGAKDSTAYGVLKFSK